MSEYGEDYWIDLGRRWVAAGCGWMPGVVTMPDGLGRTWRKTARGWEQDAGGRFRSPMPRGSETPPPDLRDPATVGCLLVRVREAWGDKWANAGQGGADWWEVCCEPSVNDWHTFSGKTEAEALVRALENAPPRKG